MTIESAVEIECGLEFAAEKIATAMSWIKRASDHAELPEKIALSVPYEKLRHAAAEIQTLRGQFGATPVANDEDEIIEA